MIKPTNNVVVRVVLTVIV